jgi:NAD(P)-dependent dehydrogenase (short-subunit alcohol dehydrogenase family)
MYIIDLGLCSKQEFFMKIIIIGAQGVIGSAIVSALEKDHQIIKVGKRSGDVQANISDPAAIDEMYKKIGLFDAVICAAGDGYFGPFSSMTDDNFRISIDGKLMSQVNLVLIGQKYISPKGSFTLTSGSLAHDPIAFGSSVSTVNAAIDGFVRSAAIALENGIRINSIAPGVVEASPSYFPYFPGDIPASMHKVGQAYVKSVLGAQTGQTYTIIG